MKEANIFQMILLGVFGFFIILAVLGFSGFVPGFGGKQDKDRFLGNVIVWGTLPARTMTETIGDMYGSEKTVSITYIEKRKSTFDRDLVEALASGSGPDIILLPQDLILRHADKVYAIPYETLSQRDFKNRFIEEGELYLSEEGVLALPFIIDPMVMYWNRDSFSSAGLSSPPAFWDEFFTIAPLLTSKDRESNIIKSALSFGEFRNVLHAKDIISMLIMQAGNPIVVKSPMKKSGVATTLDESFNYEVLPTNAAVRFFTEFSNPVKTSYSWNRSLQFSQDMFVSGDLAVYLGYASELSLLQRKNPHLNFDVAEVPQSRGGGKKITFGRMQGLAILKASPNIPASFRAVSLLSDAEFISLISGAINLPPVRRDLLSKKPTDSYLPLFYDAALVSRAWLDPSPELTDTIFREMIERVVSGRSKVYDAVSTADVELERLLK
ncbi:MAG: hypothetical protein BMS9Abin13_524 [Patescibacteria group bacterium]|nr:MAG: hypothetical protein BMS9Abin13_524 [Patescibacteria group bacterium]